MSYLDKPRIGFFGEHAMTNPSTANNENVIHLLDYDNVELLNPPALEGADLEPMSDVAYREWMTTLMTYDRGFDPDNPNPKEPGWSPAMPGYWNYYGDHLTTFGDATVNGVWLNGQASPSRSGDGLVGARVVFDAKLVDVDPADTFSSQLISAAFSLVGPDANGKVVKLLDGIPTIAHLRWTNFYRPFGAGTFQCVIPNNTLTFVDVKDAPVSAGLEALRQGAARGGGLVLRYCLYGMRAGGLTSTYDRFQVGDYAWNPKIGFVVGTIGVWNGTDMQNTPVGRLLHQPGWPSPLASAGESQMAMPHVGGHDDLEALHVKGTQPSEALAQLAPRQTLGPAAAVLSGDVLTLDLLTTFPEQAPGSPDKIDLGPVKLLVEDQHGLLVLGDVDYSGKTYVANAGVVEFGIATDVLDRVRNGMLVLNDKTGTMLQEIDVVQVETDDRGVYLDMEPDESGKLTARGTVGIRSFRKGEPTTGPVELTVQVWADDIVVGNAESLSPLVVHQNYLRWKQLGEYHVTVQDGIVEFQISTTRAGCQKLRFLPAGVTPPAPYPQWAVEFYANFRVLPYHDYSNVPDKKITWDFIYSEVFRYYGILYPIMSLIIPWGPDTLPNDPVRVGQFAAIMRQAVDRKYLGTALSMPITRELDEGKRRLVQRWCDLQPRPGP